MDNTNNHNMVRRVSFSDINTVMEFENSNPTLGNHNVEVFANIKRATVDVTELPDIAIRDESNPFNLERYNCKIESLILSSNKKNEEEINKISAFLKKSVLNMLEREFFNYKTEKCDMRSGNFFLYYTNNDVEGYNKKRHRSYNRSDYEKEKERIKKNSSIINKEPTRENLTTFYKKILTSTRIIGLSKNSTKKMLSKYIINTMFNNFLIKNKSQYILLNIIAKLLLKLDTLNDLEYKTSVLSKILDNIIDFIIEDNMSDLNDNIYYAREKNKRLLTIVNFLEKSLAGLLKKPETPVFLYLYITANKSKIQSLNLSSSVNLNVNAVDCQYEKIWGGISLLERHKETHKIEFLPADSALESILNPCLNKELRRTDVTIAQTEDYNIQNDRIPEAIKNTNCLFKTVFLADNTTYYSGIRFGLADAVYINDSVFMANRNHIHIIEKLIKASVMAMPNSSTVVNAGVEAFNHHDHDNPVVYITSVIIASNKEEISLAQEHNKNITMFHNKSHSFETALHKLKLKNNNISTKLIADTIFIDLTTKILPFSFIESDDLNEASSLQLNLINNELPLQNMLGKLSDTKDFFSIKLLEHIVSSSFSLTLLKNDDSMLANFCKIKLKDFINIESDNNVSFNLPSDLTSHLNKLLILAKNIESGYKSGTYNIYIFMAHILLLSSLIGGAQLSCCENGLIKAGTLDNHIKWLATELFANNNLSIDINTAATENELYKNITEKTTNKQEYRLFY